MGAAILANRRRGEPWWHLRTSFQSVIEPLTKEGPHALGNTLPGFRAGKRERTVGHGAGIEPTIVDPK
ncbi:hypothetical protein [Burkholderia metallica]|uniref:hypothetical protein n=1 Tax=Burkholderia metallica TaxID=488729 RepID=UPI00131AB2E2|nr:hypothetical protein [Burkholderia metallica]